MTIDVASLFEWITAPAGGVVIVCIILYWVAKSITAVVSWVAARLDTWVNKHFETLSRIIQDSEEDRKLYKESITKILSQFDEIDHKIDTQSKKIDKLVQLVSKESKS